MILKKKYSFRRDSNLRSMHYGRALYRYAIWIDDEVAYIRCQIPCLQVNQVYAIIVTKWQVVNNFEQMLCKNSSNINISFHWRVFDKNVTRMLQQEGILSILKKNILSQFIWNVRMTSLSMDRPTCFNVIDWTPRPLAYRVFFLNFVKKP